MMLEKNHSISTNKKNAIVEKQMKFFILLIIILVISAVPSTYGYGNPLESTELHAKNADISLDIKFANDILEPLLAKTIIQNNIENIALKVYDDVISLPEAELKVTDNADNFKILSLPESILIYGYKNTELEQYDINLYIATDNGLQKFSLLADIPTPIEKTTDTKESPAEPQYIPELLITSSHDFRTYWKEDFNIDVQTFDGNINPDPKSASDFNGRIDGIRIRVLLSNNDGARVATLSGVTTHGEWKGKHYFEENISKPGEYLVDITASHLGKSVSKTSSMFVIGAVDDGSTNQPPVSDAGANQTHPEHNGEDPMPAFTVITLNGSASSDYEDGDNIRYQWTLVSESPDITLSNMTVPRPTFVAPDVETDTDLTFELRVADSKGRESLKPDFVTITIRPVS